ncbi:MAG: microcin ABC transporter permease, partial [Pseudomonadales bacterium]
MAIYILKRLLLLIPTLLGIITINFIIVQFAPGGPVEQIIAQVTTGQTTTTANITGAGDSGGGDVTSASAELGSYGLDPALIA